MMKMVFVAAVFAVLLSSTAFGWDPYSHAKFDKSALEYCESHSSRICSIILANKDCFYFGSELVDITVIYYFTNFANYEATHNWALTDELLSSARDNCELAVAYGTASHLLADSASHNSMVPRTIRDTYVPNTPIHMVKEAGVLSYTLQQDIQAYELGRRSMDMMDTRPDILDWVQSKIQSSRGIQLNVRQDATTLRNAIASPSGFFDKVFAIGGIYQAFAFGNLIGGLILLLLAFGLFKLSQRFDSLLPRLPIYLFIFIFGILSLPLLMPGGLAGLMPVTDADKADMQLAVDRINTVFSDQGWGTRYSFDPTGYAALHRADAGIWMINITAAIIIAIALFAAFKYRYQK